MLLDPGYKRAFFKAELLAQLRRNGYAAFGIHDCPVDGHTPVSYCKIRGITIRSFEIGERKAGIDERPAVV